jgi:hypothetical protein
VIVTRSISYVQCHVLLLVTIIKSHVCYAERIPLDTKLCCSKQCRVCAWVSRHEHITMISIRESLRAAGLNCALEVPMLIPHSDKRPGDLFACLGRHPSNPVPRNTAMDVTIRSSRVAARRRHAAEKPGGSATFAEQEKRNDLAKAIAAAAAAAGTRSPLYDGTSSR